MLVVPAVAVALLALSPVAYLLVRATEGGPNRLADLVLRDRTAELLARSLALTAAVTVACLVVGTALALATTRLDVPGRRVLVVLAALPLAVPTYVAAFAWISVLPDLDGFWGTFLVLTSCSYPYVLLPVRAALLRQDGSAEDVARTLGLSAGQTLRRVTLPVLRPALAAGGLLVALYTLSDFGAPSLMRHDVFTRVIYSSYTSSFDRQAAAALSLVLVAVTLLVVTAQGRGPGRTAAVTRAASRPAAPGRTGPAGTALTWAGSLAVAAVALGVPAAALGYWTARGVGAQLQLDDVLAAASTTLGYAAAGAVVTALLAVPVGLLAGRSGSPLPRLLERATYVGHALPGVVIALAVVFLFIRVDALEPLYQRPAMLVVAYVVLFLPLAVGAVHASAATSPPALEEVARVAGLRPLAVVRRVSLPLARPGVAAGAALVFLTCAKELPATLLIAPPGTATLATELWTLTGVAAYSAAAPYAALLVALSAVPTYLLLTRGSRA